VLYPRASTYFGVSLEEFDSTNKVALYYAFLEKTAITKPYFSTDIQLTPTNDSQTKPKEKPMQYLTSEFFQSEQPFGLP
jgi:hypothetical protein